MANVLRLMKDIAEKQSDFAFVDSARCEKAKQAFDRGIECVLKTQIAQDGKLTGWCQQYDAQTLQPTKARTYERGFPWFLVDALPFFQYQEHGVDYIVALLKGYKDRAPWS